MQMIQCESWNRNLGILEWRGEVVAFKDNLNWKRERWKNISIWNYAEGIEEQKKHRLQDGGKM